MGLLFLGSVAKQGLFLDVAMVLCVYVYVYFILTIVDRKVDCNVINLIYEHRYMKQSSGICQVPLHSS